MSRHFRNPVVQKTGCWDPDLAEEMFNTRAMEVVVEVTSSTAARTPCPTHPIAVRALIATPVRPQVVMIKTFFIGDDGDLVCLWTT